MTSTTRLTIVAANGKWHDISLQCAGSNLKNKAPKSIYWTHPNTTMIISAIATTESLTPWQTHKKYGERATCETWVEESKGQMGMGKIRTAEFLANAIIFHCAVLAYNTLRWMAIMSGSQTLRQWEPETIHTVWFV